MSRVSVRPVHVSALISAPPEEVFNLVSDTRNDPLWCPNVDVAELVSGEDVEVGSRFTFSQHLDRGGKRVEFDAEVEVTELDERSIDWVVTDRFQERRISVSVESHPKGTRITQITRATFHKDPGLAVRVGYPFLAKRTLKDQFRQLEGYLSS